MSPITAKQCLPFFLSLMIVLPITQCWADCTVPNSPGVNICSPLNGATVTSPFTISASGGNTNATAGMDVWLDGNKVGWFGGTTSVNIQDTAGTGSHQLDIYAIGTDGEKQLSSVIFTVGGGGGGGTCPQPASPDVNICLPATGSTVTSPFTISASGRNTNGTAGMDVWLDGNKVGWFGGTTSVNIQDTAGAGSHQLDIYAIGTDGEKQLSSVIFTVRGGGAGGGSRGCSGLGSGYDNQNGAITGVWLQSPSPGQNPSHVQVNATAFGPATVTNWVVCLDDQVVYQTDNVTSSISQGIDIPLGQHLLYARAWDAQGDSNRSEVKLIQVGPPPPSSTVLPTPPANAQVLREMQNDTANWSICSLCAQGTNSTDNFWMAPFQTQPSLSGSSLEMYADGPSWSNVLFIDTLLGTSSNSHFLWDFWVYHDPAAEIHFWASEFDLWQVLGGKEFMIGSQCDFGDGYWSTWDSGGNRWILNGIPCPHWAPGWHHIQWYVERISPTQYRYDTLVFDGQAYGFNQTWTVNPTTWPDMVGIQYQLDQDPTGTPLHEWVDNVTLTMW